MWINKYSSINIQQLVYNVDCIDFDPSIDVCIINFNILSFVLGLC